MMILLIEHLAHLYGIDHHLEDAEVVTGTDVTAQSHHQSFVKELSDGSHA